MIIQNKNSDKTLNDNDNKLLAYCSDAYHSVGEIAKYLGISVSSVSIKLHHLKKLNKIIIHREGKGKKTIVRTKGTDKLFKYRLYILNELKKRKGNVSDQEYFGTSKYGHQAENPILPINYEEIMDGSFHDKSQALWSLIYSPFLERRVVLTKEGRDELKKYSKIARKRT